jgi:hypothetical protein
VNPIEIILKNPEYFYCEKTKCTLKVSICRQRQIKNRKTPAFLFIPFPVCEKCEQGAKNMEEKIEKTITKDLCKECGQKPVISPGSSLCASCLARRSNKARGQEKPQQQQKKEAPCRHVVAVNKNSEKDQTAITLNFGKYASVLSEVKTLAEKEMRTIDLQVIYILSRYLEDHRQGANPS